MKEYCVIRKKADLNWEEIPFLEVSEQPWFVIPNIKMSSQLMWDEDNLYVHQVALESQIRSTFTTHLSHVCEDSCMEFFISPQPEDERYFNFEINPYGALMLGFGRGRNDRIRLLPKDPTNYFSIKTNESLGKWEVFYQIPATFFEVFFPNFKFERGLNLRANFYKCGDKTEKPHYLTWNKVTSSKPDFHRPEDFGLISFS